MKRAPRTPLEAKFVANLQTILPILLGEPEQDDGREFVFHDAVGKVAITYSAADPDTTAVFIRRNDSFGGAGFDLLELFDLTEDDVAQVFDQLELGEEAEPPPVGNNEARSAPVFQEMLATARDDDGRIECYLAGRGLPGMAHHVRLVTMKGEADRYGGVGCRPTVIGDPVALQVLPLDSVGRPAMVDGKKVRRTFTSIKGWTHDAAFSLPALEGGRTEVVMCEGTEDALSVPRSRLDGHGRCDVGQGQHRSPFSAGDDGDPAVRWRRRPARDRRCARGP